MKARRIFQLPHTKHLSFHTTRLLHLTLSRKLATIANHFPLQGNRALRPQVENHRRSPRRQAEQHNRTRRKQAKPDHDPVRQRVHKRVHNPDSHVRPRRLHGGRVVDSQVG